MMQGPRVCIPSSLIFLPPVPVPTPAPHHPSPWSSFCPSLSLFWGLDKWGPEHFTWRHLYLPHLYPGSGQGILPGSSPFPWLQPTLILDFCPHWGRVENGNGLWDEPCLLSRQIGGRHGCMR
jgi:hypothetical protein